MFLGAVAANIHVAVKKDEYIDIGLL